MEILSTVDPDNWQPPAIICSKCGTKFKAHLDEFEKSFTYPRYYDYYSVGSGPAWIPYKVDWININCPTCNKGCRIENIPSPVTELWLKIRTEEVKAHMKANPRDYELY